MGITKEVYYRFLAYDKCLRKTTRRYTWQELADAANRALSVHSIKSISKATFFRDMNTLKAPPWGAPVVSDHGLYSYSDPSFSILNLPLSAEETEQLKSALTVLTRFKGLPQFEWIRELIPKMEKQFGLDQQMEVIGFEENVDLVGLGYFDELFDSIVNKCVLEITYQPFKSPNPTLMVIHPYYLKQYNGRWFLFGHNSLADKLYNLPLDRIQSIIPNTAISFIENVTDFNEYFEDMIGVTKFEDKEVEKITLWFAAEQAHYIETKPLHSTQKKMNWLEDGSATTSISVIPNVELEHLILRFGNKCKVLEPLSLVSRIAEILALAKQQYD